MDSLLYLAATLIVGIGIAHSYLGEKYILIRLFRRDDLPKLFGSQDFTVKTLRLAWHITTVAWWGFAAILVALARPPVAVQGIGLIIATVFFVHFAIALVGSGGRHLSWIVFLLIAILAYFATGQA